MCPGSRIRRSLAILSLAVLSAIPFPVLAAGEEYPAVVSTPDAAAFPKMTVYYEIHDPQGNFVSGLTDKQVWAVEDGKILSLSSLQEFRIGVQFSLVINAAPSFSLRNAKGVSRLNTVRTEIQNWGNTEREIATDDLSLIANETVLIAHTPEAATWLAALESYQPDLKTTVPDVRGLSSALDLAGETNPGSPMKHAVLWITPPPDDAAIGAIPNLIQRANSTGTKIFIWMISPSTEFNKPPAQVLRDFAAKTGGSFFAFSGLEPFPSIASLLEPMRSLYQVSYLSGITTGGSHSLAIRAKLSELEVTTLPVPFTLQIQAPNPIFVGLPASVVRTAAEDAAKPLEALVPESLPVEILVEFPDHHTRSLTHSALYVDDVLVAENTRAPFEKFEWNLKSYTASGDHRLRVEVTDELGLKQSTIEMPVKVTVVLPQNDLWSKLTRNGGMIAILIALLALGMLAGVVLMTWHGRRSPELKQATPAPPGAEPRGRSGTAAPVNSRQMVTPMPAAQLLRLDEHNQPMAALPILLNSPETSFGSDVTLADVVIDSPSVAGLHATISLGEDGNYYLHDLGSISGTWLNFAPISSQPVALEHGDCIHFGQVPFRFILAAPRVIRKPSIQPVK